MKNIYKDLGCGGTILFILGLLVLLAIICLIQAGIALWLWGAIMIPVFGAPVLSFWQMYGLIWLIHILFPHSSTSFKSNN